MMPSKSLNPKSRVPISNSTPIKPKANPAATDTMN